VQRATRPYTGVPAGTNRELKAAFQAPRKRLAKKLRETRRWNRGYAGTRGVRSL